MDEILEEIIVDMKLTKSESEEFLRDVENLEGNKWLSKVESTCSPRLIHSFTNMLDRQSVNEAELLDDMERGYY